MTDQELIQALIDYTKQDDWPIVDSDVIQLAIDRLAALQSENAELREENGCLQHNVAAMHATLDQQAKNCEALLVEKDREIASREQASIDAHAETHHWRDKARTAEAALSRVEAERDKAMAYVPKQCGTCGRQCDLKATTPIGLQLRWCDDWLWRGAQGEG